MQPFCQDFFIFACRGQRLVVQRDSDGDVRRGQLTAIRRLQDQLTQGLALLAVNEPGRRFVRIEQIVVCPLGEGDQHRLQGTALIGQDILLPGAAVGGRLQAQDAFIHQHFQPPGEHVFGDTEVFLEFAKTAHPAQSIADDQQRPPVADNVEGAGDRATAVLQTGTFHESLQVNCFIIKLFALQGKFSATV